MKSSKMRKPRGALLILLSWIVGFLIVLSLGLLAFEIARGNTAYEQLRSATEAAALSGGASLAGSNIADPTTAHTTAQSAALTTFKSNTVLSQLLSGATQTTSASSNPTANASGLYVEFLNPNSTPVDQVTALSDVNGKVVHAVGTFGLVPAFLNLSKVFSGASYPLRVDAYSRVPSLDIALCFDVSSSIDDQTVCTFANRYWDLVHSKVAYAIPSCAPRGSESPSNPTPTGATTLPPGAVAVSGNGPFAEGPMLQILDSIGMGTATNILPPQQLDQSSVQPNAAAPLYIDATERNTTGVATSIASIADAGVAPGNYSSIKSVTYTPQQYYYTDCVCNLDYKSGGSYVFGKNTSFTVPTSSGRFAFPDLATLIEAQRGNLENLTVFNSSKANTKIENAAVIAAVTAAGANGSSGYHNAYLYATKQLCQPIGSMQQAALNFFNIMNVNTNAHFSFITFGNKCATFPTDTQQTPTIQIGSTDTSGTPLSPTSPTVPLSSTSNNYATITGVDGTGGSGTDLVTLGQALGGTDISDAVIYAYNELTTSGTSPSIIFSNDNALQGTPGTAPTPAGRAGSKKVVIVFTDGQQSSSPPETWPTICAACKKAGVAIFTVGFAQSPKIISGECDLLNDSPSGSLNPITYTDPFTGASSSYTPSQQGIAGMAGNGGKFFLVTNAANLNYVFENIARQLVQLTNY